MPSKEELAVYRETFDQLDTDKNGKLDVDEFQNFFRKIDPNASKFMARVVMKAIDTDKNGTIEFNEWVDFLEGKTSTDLTDYQAFTFAFEIGDTNKDGKLSFEEFGALVKELGIAQSPEEIKKAFGEADTDKNGFIDKDEWIRACISSSLHEYQEIFNALDTDKNGKLDQNEIDAFFRKIDPNASKFMARAAMLAIDTDKNGTIEFNEWVDFMIGKTTLNLTDQEAFIFAFEAGDTNKDGKLSLEEFSTLVKELGVSTDPSEIKKMFEEADTDKNGFIDKNEFIAACNK